MNAGGLRLCVDSADDQVHRAGSSDPVIGLEVESLAEALAALGERGLQTTNGPARRERGSYAVVRDPDGRAVMLTEAD